jgi:hypothetical protein
MPSISTRYLPPTHTKGARVKAHITGRTKGPSVTIGFHSVSGDAHDWAARLLAEELSKGTDDSGAEFWRGAWFRVASTDDDKGWVYVHVSTTARPDFNV